MTYTHCTVLAPGCYSGQTPPIITRHATLDAAIRRAARNDRLAVYALEHSAYGDYATGDCLFLLPAQGDRKLGAGRYGNGPNTRGGR